MKRFLFSVLFLGTLNVVSAQQTKSVQTSIEVISSDDHATTLKFNPGTTVLRPVTTPQGQQYIATVDQGTPVLRQGAPDMEKLTASVIIPDEGNTNVVVVSAEYHDLQNVQIAPSKGNLYRNQDPAAVPYVYGEEYSRNAFFPLAEAELNAPYVLRDYRGQAVHVFPFRYNAVTKTLRVYDEITVRIESVPGTGLNELRGNARPVTVEFDAIYERQFVNYEFVNQSRYTPVGEQGEMLIISHANYIPALAPYILWKNKSGIKTTLVDISTIGNSASSIKAYVANFYNTNNNAFVLLVGDAPQITPNTTQYGPSDQDYAMISGSDHYPELLIGRFSVQTVQELDLVLERTMEYEINPAAGTYYETCLGVASNQGPGDDNEMDYEHEQNIGAQLIAYNYNTFIELYDGSQGGGDAPGNPTASDCATAINGGVGLFNYTGHGSSTSIVTTGFNNTNVNALTNIHQWPLVIIVGCVTGDFVNQTCFAEAFLRAKHPSLDLPTGSVANFMSTINQSWNPPMEGQDEMNAILTETYSGNIKRTFGGICLNGCLKMNDAYGQGGDEMTDTWTMFGDPSLMVRTLNPMSMTVTHPATATLGATQFTVNCSVNDAFVTLYQNGTILGSGTVVNNSVTISFAPLSVVDTLFVTAVAYNYVPYLGHALVVPASGPYVVTASHLLTDPAGNNDNIGDFSENVLFDVSLNNVGASTANTVSAVLSTTDPYVTITDANENFGNIAVSATQSQTTAYAATIGSNVPDMHVATFTLTITDGASNTWTNTFTETLHAPALTAGNVAVDDAAANGNGVMDPSETLNIMIPTGNNGHSTTPSCIGVLTTTNPMLTINNNNLPLGTIVVNGTVNAIFSVTVSGAATIGTTVDLTYTATAGAYSVSTTYYERISIAMEDYETNDFTQFPWVTSGSLPWFTTTDNAYDDSYCSKSGAITSNQMSVMSITLNVLNSDSISFFRAVSSELNYDFLNFYIDNQLQGQWSGEQSWTRMAYAVTAGVHTFKWEYKKDYVVDDGNDCAWVDNVVFPAHNNATAINENVSTTGVNVYPNPVSDNATVNFSIEEQSDVTLYVTDAQGRTVQTLQQTTVMNQGTHRVEWNAATLASGIYFLNVNVNGKNNVQRIIVR
jgi:Peptidase family C25/Propeptide_C25/Peptidase family C25, C terminal ig-like domain/Secretion system C-terminal sorting domain